MKVLIVASYNTGHFSSFVLEQANALAQQGVSMEYFGIIGHGIMGYLRAVPALRRKICAVQPDIIHAHYGLCGLFANLQRKVPVITTYHGSDINEKKLLPFSKLSMLLSKWNIFVSQRMVDLGCYGAVKHTTIVPCGVDVPEISAQAMSDWVHTVCPPDQPYVLFAGAFDNKLKNYPLAKQVVEKVEGMQLIELKGYTRDQVTALMYNAKALLVTSFYEGGPLIVKEAMACGCPVVSVDVGDVAERLNGLEGCYVSKTRNVDELAAMLRHAVRFGRTNGREYILRDGLDNRQIAQKLIAIYSQVIAHDY